MYIWLMLAFMMMVTYRGHEDHKDRGYRWMSVCLIVFLSLSRLIAHLFVCFELFKWNKGSPNQGNIVSLSFHLPVFLSVLMLYMRTFLMN